AMETDMEFNVSQLMKEAVGAKRTYEFGMPDLLLSEPLEGEERSIVARDVHGSVQFTRLRAQIRVVGRAEAQVELQCGRCLEPFVATIEAPLDELFNQTIDVVSGKPVEGPADPDDDSFAIDQNHILDLTEPVRQALLVALPMQPLHSENCKGLCPICGTNLNVTQCDCPTEVLDPRLAGLSQLLAGANLGDEPSQN
ncbi:MAG TPA: DUF177 domain-containing protein, partial [Chloroflexia bacterium]|nr:DUF177 domain-containing protein [Chloroflexia bacterium]